MTNGTGSSRRRFIAGAAAAGAAAGAVVALPKLPADPRQALSNTESPKPERGGGYHLSEHVKHYYRTTLV